MGDLFTSLFTIIVGLAVLAGVLLLLYGLTMRLPSSWRNRTQSWLFLGPAVLTIFAGLLVPAVKTVYTSFLDDAPKNPKFIGLANFKEIFTDVNSRLVVFNSLTWVLLGTLAVIVSALAIARFADGMKGERIAKSSMFIPTCTSLAGAGIIWRFVYAGPPIKVGLLNAVTKFLHLPPSMGGDGERLWLTERGFWFVKQPPGSAPGFNTLLLIIVFIWSSAGIAVVIFSAAIKGVPESLIEAAKVDGATNRQVFYKVTLPYIRSTIVTVATLTVIAGFKAFDIVASSTGGRAGTSTIANEWYVTFFLQNRDGFSSAFAVVLFVLVIPFVVINRRAQRRAEELMAA